MNKILIIEDDQSIREALEYNLKIAGFAVTGAADGKIGLEQALKIKPDLILLDIMLPGIDGFQFCQKLREENDNVAILMVSALATEADKLKSFSLGADDYITKPFSTSELLARIRVHLRRSKQKEVIAANPMEFGDSVMDPANYGLEVGGEPVDLRPKEYQLLAFLAANPDKLFSRPQLAQEVWGDRYVSSSRTIDVHIRRIRNKVERQSAFSFIQTVHSLGYRFDLKRKSGKTAKQSGPPGESDPL